MAGALVTTLAVNVPIDRSDSIVDNGDVAA